MGGWGGGGGGEGELADGVVVGYVEEVGVDGGEGVAVEAEGFGGVG